jgi:hypothetical protein
MSSFRKVEPPKTLDELIEAGDDDAVCRALYELEHTNIFQWLDSYGTALDYDFPRPCRWRVLEAEVMGDYSVVRDKWTLNGAAFENFHVGFSAWLWDQVLERGIVGTNPWT